VQTRREGDAVAGVTRVTLDGIEQGDKTIAIFDDRKEHLVEVMVTLK